MMTSTTIFFIFIPVLVTILIAVNLLLSPHSPYLEKDSPFECGFHSFLGQSRTQFAISFFLFGLLFLLFDLEIVLIFPHAITAYNNEGFGLIILLIFLIIVTVGFAFEYGKGALKIYSKQNTSTENNIENKTNISLLKNTKTLISKTHPFSLFGSPVIATNITYKIKKDVESTNYSVEADDKKLIDSITEGSIEQPMTSLYNSSHLQNNLYNKSNSIFNDKSRFGLNKNSTLDYYESYRLKFEFKVKSYNANIKSQADDIKFSVTNSGVNATDIKFNKSNELYILTDNSIKNYDINELLNNLIFCHSTIIGAIMFVPIIVVISIIGYNCFINKIKVVDLRVNYDTLIILKKFLVKLTNMFLWLKHLDYAYILSRDGKYANIFNHNYFMSFWTYVKLTYPTVIERIVKRTVVYDKKQVMKKFSSVIKKVILFKITTSITKKYISSLLKKINVFVMIRNVNILKSILTSFLVREALYSLGITNKQIFNVYNKLTVNYLTVEFYNKVVSNISEEYLTYIRTILRFYGFSSVLVQENPDNTTPLLLKNAFYTKSSEGSFILHREILIKRLIPTQQAGTFLPDSLYSVLEELNWDVTKIFWASLNTSGYRIKVNLEFIMETITSVEAHERTYSFLAKMVEGLLTELGASYRGEQFSFEELKACNQVTNIGYTRLHEQYMALFSEFNIGINTNYYVGDTPYDGNLYDLLYRTIATAIYLRQLSHKFSLVKNDLLAGLKLIHEGVNLENLGSHINSQRSSYRPLTNNNYLYGLSVHDVNKNILNFNIFMTGPFNINENIQRVSELEFRIRGFRFTSASSPTDINLNDLNFKYYMRLEDHLKNMYENSRGHNPRIMDRVLPFFKPILEYNAHVKAGTIGNLSKQDLKKFDVSSFRIPGSPPSSHLVNNINFLINPVANEMHEDINDELIKFYLGKFLEDISRGRSG